MCKLPNLASLAQKTRFQFFFFFFCFYLFLFFFLFFFLFCFFVCFFSRYFVSVYFPQGQFLLESTKRITNRKVTVSQPFRRHKTVLTALLFDAQY